MSWFYERFVMPSEISGPILCTRLFGQWSVMAGGNGQANPYLNDLWKGAFKRMPKDLAVKRILMLGFGPGETLPFYAKRFPKASLTVVEIDPAMVELARRFGRLSSKRPPEILVGDAADVLPKIQGSYDLIIFDMFAGLQVAPATYQATLLAQVKRLLRPHGAILMNAFREPAAFEVLQKQCALVERWRYKQNHLAWFRPFGSGTLGDPLPAVYQHVMTCEAYIKREYAHQTGRFEIVHAGAAGSESSWIFGLRTKLLGVVFDYYTNNRDPARAGLPTGARMTFWQPISEVPKNAPGWHRCPFPGNRQYTGFAQIPLEGPYYTQWSDHAKRHRERWLRQTEHELVDADLETYLEAFTHSRKRRSLVALFSEEVRRKARAHGDRLTLRVAKHRVTGEIVAGFASLWIPEIQQTFHVTSFITEAGQKTSAAFGLVDDVFRIAQSRGCRVLEFDGFWMKGNPPSWKGFSNFKAQFNVFFVRWPGLWVRWN
jgi:SAM-dependent methyltransferase